MRSLATYTASIFVGQRVGYTQEIRPILLALEWLQERADKGGMCVTVTPTTFIYKDGTEPGFIIGCINYPRFPENPLDIKTKALEIAEAMLLLFGQNRVSVVCSDETITLEPLSPPPTPAQDTNTQSLCRAKPSPDSATPRQEIKADTLLGIYSDGSGETIVTNFESGINWPAWQRLADWLNGRAATTGKGEQGQ
jgi:hypothetical protein